MDAIPSLCASTASCGAAATGFAFGRSTSTSIRGNERAGANGDSVSPATVVEPRLPPSTPALQAPKPAAFRRPQSATVPKVSAWSIFGRTSLDETVTAPVGGSEQQRYTGLVTKPLNPIEEPEERPERLSWARRVSTITQSRDGSTTTRPSSPSLFSNGSNVPFLGSIQPVTPRNKLVKRSTSHRILHSGGYSGSPFPTSQASTFRRPATSHQRSEQLKLQSLRREFESPTRALETFDENSTVTQTGPRPQPDPNHNEKWRLFFRSKNIQTATETRKRSASVPRIPKLTTASPSPRKIDTIRCVEPPLGEVPTLLKPSDLGTQPSFEPYTRHTKATLSASTVPASTQPSSTTSQTDKIVKPRNSFSVGDIMSTPSPPWKLKTGSLGRKKGRDAMNTGRRVASAPLQGLDGGIDENNTPETSSGSKPFVLSSRVRGNRAPEKITRQTSSPFPPPNRELGYDNDVSAEPSSRPFSPTTTHLTSDAAQVKPESSPKRQQSSADTKSQRPTRIPSDQESTVFSSDNEHSRVFSADGDDTDYRSETIFDSIRTDATGHSHTGGKSHRIESVFQETSTSELVKYNLEALQEKLEHSSTSDVTVQHRAASETDDSSRTPVQSRQSEKKDFDRHRQPLPTTAFTTSSQPTLKTPTRRAESYPQEIDLEDWSADEGDDEKDEVHPRTPGQLPPNRADTRRRLHGTDLPERPKSNIFDWSERNPLERDGLAGSSPRPRTAHVKQVQERGSRSVSRRGPGGYHIRSQSVPLPPESSNHRFNNASKLDAWILGGKGVSEDWGDDFEFDEDTDSVSVDRTERIGPEKAIDGVIVPSSIIEKQASVHGQFGQVKELTLLVEELRRLRHSAFMHGILHGQASELWKEAEGIIDLATLDEDDSELFPPHSPTSTSFDFDAFDDDSPSLSRRRRSSASPQVDALNDGPGPSRPSPGGSKFDTPTGRPRKESIAKAKNVLENIHQHRSSLDPLPDTKSSKKLPFDTTSLRDLVTRAGVVTRALKEIIRRIENPDSTPHTPERSSEPPPDPPFSQIFNQPSPSSPSSSKKSPRIARRKSSSSFLSNSKPANDNDFNGHMKIMTVA